MRVEPSRTEVIRGVRQEIRSLVRLTPHPSSRVWIALRAAISMAVPFGVLTALGHQSVGLQVSAGAFTSLYVASASAMERVKVLPLVGLAHLVCALLGILLAPWLWVWATGLAVVAVASSALVFAFRLGPPGTVFFVLGYGLAANATHSVGGSPIAEPLDFLIAMGGGVLFSVIVAATPLLRRVERQKSARTIKQILPGPWLGAGERELLIRVAVFSLAATLVGVLLLDPHRVYWTVASGLAIIALRTGRTVIFGRGLHRMVGTLVGAALFVAIAPLGEIPWLLVVMLGTFQFIIEIIIVRNYALALVFITPLVLFIIGAVVRPDQLLETAGVRVIDTIAGCVIAIVTVLLVRSSAKVGEGD